MSQAARYLSLTRVDGADAQVDTGGRVADGDGDNDTTYYAVHFFGRRLHRPLREAAAYLERLERSFGDIPNVICLQEEYSPIDEGGELAWQVTLVLGPALSQATRTPERC